MSDELIFQKDGVCVYHTTATATDGEQVLRTDLGALVGVEQGEVVWTIIERTDGGFDFDVCCKRHGAIILSNFLHEL